jgi:hypothetical protein
VRRIGLLMNYDENEPVAKARVSAFTQALAGLRGAIGSLTKVADRLTGENSRTVAGD